MNDRKKSGVAFWVTVALVAVLFSILSIGPILWAAEKWPTSTQVQLVEIYVWPAQWAYDNGPAPVGSALHWYAGLYVE